MAEGRQSAKHGFVSKVSKRAFTPLAQAAVTAGSAYLTRKAMQLWQDKLQPKLEDRGGSRTVAKEVLETVAEKAPARNTAPPEKLIDFSGFSGTEPMNRAAGLEARSTALLIGLPARKVMAV